MEGAQIVGFVQAGLGGEAAEIGEIRVLYVRPAWARRGHGGRLIAAAARRCGPGAGSGEWWIPETDIASQRFAGSIGWVAPGGVRVLDTGRAHADRTPVDRSVGPGPRGRPARPRSG